MVKRDMSEDQIKADIPEKLVNRGMWGKGHQDVDQLRKWLSNKLKKNGKRVTRVINELTKDQYIGQKNNGRSIYANPKLRREIMLFIDSNEKK